MTKKLGGWTRLLIVISGALFVIGALDMSSARDRARKEAQEKYEAAMAPPPKECTDGSDSNEGFRKFICAPPVPESEAAAKRDAEIAASDDKSLKAFFAVWLYPTAFIGAAFLAVGWIKRGFQQRHQ